jgi:hypothetical protein
MEAKFLSSKYTRFSHSLKKVRITDGKLVYKGCFRVMKLDNYDLSIS